MMNTWIRQVAALGVALYFLVGCQPPQQENSRLYVVATTGMLADAARQIAGDQATVVGLMGPGVDPHLYKATQGDLTELRKADLIIYNGLHLEGKMGEVLGKLGREKAVFAAGETLPRSALRNAADGSDAYDPHIWFDVSLWRQAVAAITEELAATDTLHREVYQQRGQDYLSQLDSLHRWVGETLAQIPDSSRVLITAHDAFEYFGAAYQIEVQGLQGISTVAEYGLKDVKELVDLIVERNIKAVFVESSVPVKSLEAVVAGCRQKGHEVRIGGTLYSDAMGEAGSDAGTYLGMVRHNVETIVAGLK